MFEFIEKVVYINLDRREDRREHMERITGIFGDKVVRFSGIVVPGKHGSVGCGRSHLAVLKMALEQTWKNVLVLEDDVEWNNFEQGYSILKKLVSNPYDVIMLGGSYVSHDSSSHKLFSARTTSSYLVNAHYLTTLIQNIETGNRILTSGGSTLVYATDVFWKELQQKDNWFIIFPSLMYQRPDYSDIEEREVDYTTVMKLSQKPLLSFLRNRR
jgi:glycosyl transferase family 25